MYTCIYIHVQTCICICIYICEQHSRPTSLCRAPKSRVDVLRRRALNLSSGLTHIQTHRALNLSSGLTNIQTHLRTLSHKYAPAIFHARRKR